MKISSFFARAAVGLGCLGFAAAGARGQGVWNYSGPIYSFGSRAFASDGASPNGGVVVSPDGKTLYGTTYSGGKHGQGTVFAFTPPTARSRPSGTSATLEKMALLLKETWSWRMVSCTGRRYTAALKTKVACIESVPMA
jgi:uncharacterized repeat protein (TIGR03803 family)